MPFHALVLDQADDTLTATVKELTDGDLPEADTTVDVLYSSINYKDALAVTGKGKIIRSGFPIIPGIDLVGEVVESTSDRWAPGDRVIGTGWQLGEVAWGGLTQRQKVDGEKLVALPKNMTPRQAMIAGTAGFTAMLSVMALEEHGVTGDVVVTGASGGAGSFAVALLKAAGCTPVASTGSEDAHEYLKALGAARIVHRDAFSDGPSRAMESGEWDGAIDAVGGKTLATLIAQTKRRGSIAAFGNAGGHELNTTVFPFILRGVNLLGIDSNTCPNDRRARAWRRMADALDDAIYDRLLHEEISLADVPDAAATLIQSGIRGRYLVGM